MSNPADPEQPGRRATEAQTLEEKRKHYAEMAKEICPMTDSEAAYLRALFEMYMDQGSCTEAEAVTKVCTFAGIPPPDAGGSTTSKNPQAAKSIDAFIEWRREELKTRNFREKLRCTLLSLSADGSTLDYDVLLEGFMDADTDEQGEAPPADGAPANANEELRKQTREAERGKTEELLLYTFFYRADPEGKGQQAVPRVTERPAGASPKILIDTFVKNYFMEN